MSTKPDTTAANDDGPTATGPRGVVTDAGVKASKKKPTRKKAAAKKPAARKPSSKKASSKKAAAKRETKADAKAAISTGKPLKPSELTPKQAKLAIERVHKLQAAVDRAEAKAQRSRGQAARDKKAATEAHKALELEIEGQMNGAGPLFENA
jgi:hypothetical protein